jgi:hypothetical protein
MATRLEIYFFAFQALRVGVWSLSPDNVFRRRGQRVLQALRFRSWIAGEDA